MGIKATPKLIAWLKANDPNGMVPVAANADQTTKDLVHGKQVARLLLDGRLDKQTFATLQNDTIVELPESESEIMPSASEVFAGSKSAGESRIRVKGSDESYSTKRVTGVHVKTGKPVQNPFTQRPAEYNSELDNARAGVFLKHLAQRSGLFPSVSLKEHEYNLLVDTAETETWAGQLDGEYHDKMRDPGRVKALLDDAASGGLEITPIFFDDQIVTFPLLHGELFPRVDVRSIERGRRIEGASIGTPTLAWGQGDDVAVGLFNTNDLVAALDSTVFGCAVALEVGKDFLSDAGVNVGNVLTQVIAERMQAELDRLIAVGNGTTQPEGITVAAGLGVANADNAAAGPPTFADFLSLLFSIEKQYRNQSARPAFVSNDTTFQRSRGIAIDAAAPSTDQRPVLAPVSEVNEYATLGWPHAIQNDIGNRTCIYGAMSRYRMYRRAGMSIQWVDGGVTLARQNKVLLVVRARYAGRVVDPAAFAAWTDGQA